MGIPFSFALEDVLLYTYKCREEGDWSSTFCQKRFVHHLMNKFSRNVVYQHVMTLNMDKTEVYFKAVPIARCILLVLAHFL